jgi:hypothetical protein
MTTIFKTYNANARPAQTAPWQITSNKFSSSHPLYSSGKRRKQVVYCIHSLPPRSDVTGTAPSTSPSTAPSNSANNSWLGPADRQHAGALAPRSDGSNTMQSSSNSSTAASLPPPTTAHHAEAKLPPSLEPSFDEDSSTKAAEIAADDVIVLLLAAAIGLSTGLAVVLFNTTVHLIQDEVVWSSIPRLAAFGTEGLQRGFSQAEGVWWRCLVLPPVCGGAVVSLSRMLVGGFDGDPKSVAAKPRNKERKSRPLTSKQTHVPGGDVVASQVPSSLLTGLKQQAGDIMPTGVPGLKTAKRLSPQTYEAIEIASALLRGFVVDVRRKGLQATMRPYVKLIAAAVTLGSGASLGPEGPSVDVGKANAKLITCAARGRVCIFLTLGAVASLHAVRVLYACQLSGQIYWLAWCRLLLALVATILLRSVSNVVLQRELMLSLSCIFPICTSY